MSSVPGGRWDRLSPGIEQPKNYQREPGTMNRQVIPSMILSVLIVCSFAIALFERDPDAAGRKPDSGQIAKKSAPARPLPAADPAKAGVARPVDSAAAPERSPRREAPVAAGPPRQGE